MSSSQQVVASIAGGKAIGGAVTFDGGYAIHTFTASGTFIANEDLTVDYLVVAGGGSGGIGGGGAGGLLTGAGHELTAGVYSVTVGAGGATSGSGNNGGDSALDSLTAIGGGRGGYPSSSGNGGSGGGASYDSSTPGTGTLGQGYDGGSPGWNVIYDYCGGSGGGAGGAGNAGTTNGTTTSVGGLGVSSSISGAAVTYCSGGNAYPNDIYSTPTIADNLGHGGHGAYSATRRAGSSGIVIIKYAL